MMRQSSLTISSAPDLLETDDDHRPSHERVLYTKLLKFREEHLENYQGPIMEYSSSDHHHVPVVHPPPVPRLSMRSSTRASLNASRVTSHYANKSVSQYALLNEDEVWKRRKTRHPSVAETEHSYDPFRSSRRPMPVSADHAKVTVLRPDSSHSQTKPDEKRLPSRVSLRQPAFDRIDEVGDYSIVSSPPPGSRVCSQISQNRSMSRGVSRVSIASSSSAGRRVSSATSKRRVSFARKRRVVSAKQPASKPPTEPLPSPPPLTLQQRFIHDGLKASQTLPVSAPATASSAQVVRSRKPVNRTNVKRDSGFWREETHRVSSELGKVCDEAFNRDSAISSAITTDASDPDRHSKSTVTSVSIHERSMTHSNDWKARLDRPLPPPPPEYLGNFAQRELAKAREMLRQRADDPTLATPGCLDDVIAHLDRLMQPSTARIDEEARRAVSAPQERSSGAGLEPRKDTFERFLESGYTGLRTISEPVKQAQKTWDIGDTIRLVEADEGSSQISPTKPLTIRKKSSVSGPSDGSVRKRASDEAPSHQLKDNPWSYAEWRSSGLALNEVPLPQIDEENKENMGLPAPKKRTWFGRGMNMKKQQQQTGEERAATATQKSARRALGELAVNDVVDWDKFGSNRLAEDLPPRKERGRFFKIFGRQEKRDGPSAFRAGYSGTGVFTIRAPCFSALTLVGNYDLDDSHSQTTASTTINLPNHEERDHLSGAVDRAASSSTSHTIRLDNPSVGDQQVPPPVVIKPHTNWFARFLRIKPASYMLCLQISRVQARKVIASILRGWKKFGLRDLVIDKARCIICVRVDAKNGESHLNSILPSLIYLHRAPSSPLRLEMLSLWPQHSTSNLWHSGSNFSLFYIAADVQTCPWPRSHKKRGRSQVWSGSLRHWRV